MNYKKHAQILAEQAKAETYDKYIIGQEEHGGELWRLPMPQLVNESIKESIDEGVYLRTLRQQFIELKKCLDQLFTILSELPEEPLPDEAESVIREIKELVGME